MKDGKPGTILKELIRFAVILAAAVLISFFVSNRLLEISGVQKALESLQVMSGKIRDLEKELENGQSNDADDREILCTEPENHSPLYGKKIIFDGDSISGSHEGSGGGYPALIAAQTGCTYINLAQGGGRLCSKESRHSVVDNLVNLPDDGDIYCFEGGINDYWGNTPLGTFDPDDYSGGYDTNTIYGAMETIFSYCLENFPGKPICFVIPHKIQNTATSPNANGDTFEDYRNAMIAVCEKYSVPYYDAFAESGLNGWNSVQSELFLTGNSDAVADGIHPNEEGYLRYYVPQLIDLFQRILPAN